MEQQILVRRAFSLRVSKRHAGGCDFWTDLFPFTGTDINEVQRAQLAFP
jgi:hypothetical protein